MFDYQHVRELSRAVTSATFPPVSASPLQSEDVVAARPQGPQRGAPPAARPWGLYCRAVSKWDFVTPEEQQQVTAS